MLYRLNLNRKIFKKKVNDDINNTDIKITWLCTAWAWYFSWVLAYFIRAIEYQSCRTRLCTLFFLIQAYNSRFFSIQNNPIYLKLHSNMYNTSCNCPQLVLNLGLTSKLDSSEKIHEFEPFMIIPIKNLLVMVWQFVALP